MLVKTIALMQGEGGAAVDAANVASSGMVGVTMEVCYLVKVLKVRGQSRVKDTVARSQQKINRSMLLCENICGSSCKSDELHTLGFG